MGNEIDVSNEENIKLINEYAESYLEEQLLSYLYKTSKELGTDIDAFGKDTLIKYLTMDDFEKSNWLHIYEDSFFDVNVDVNVKSSNLLIKD